MKKKKKIKKNSISKCLFYKEKLTKNVNILINTHECSVGEVGALDILSSSFSFIIVAAMFIIPFVKSFFLFFSLNDFLCY